MNNQIDPELDLEMDERLDETATLYDLKRWGIISEIPDWIDGNSALWELVEYAAPGFPVSAQGYIDRWDARKAIEFDSRCADANAYIRDRMNVRSWGDLLEGCPVDVYKVEIFVVSVIYGHYARDVIARAKAAGWDGKVSD